LFSLGLAMISLSDGVNVDLEGILLGEILGVSSQDVWIIFVICIITGTILYLFHKELVFNSFDPQGASVIGLPSRLLDYLLLILISLVVVASIQAVGVVLMLAMLVTPAAISYLLARSFVSMMFLGALIGVFVCIAGIYLSYFLDLPSGPSMTLVAVVSFIVTALIKRRTVF
jgi:ABC-type Mn2+/Zn2+ transport system permease subunit